MQDAGESAAEGPQGPGGSGRGRRGVVVEGMCSRTGRRSEPAHIGLSTGVSLGAASDRRRSAQTRPAPISMPRCNSAADTGVRFYDAELLRARALTHTDSRARAAGLAAARELARRQGAWSVCRRRDPAQPGLVRRVLMDEMNCQSIDFGDELVEPIERGVAGTPVLTVVLRRTHSRGPRGRSGYRHRGRERAGSLPRPASVDGRSTGCRAVAATIIRGE